MKNMSVSPPVEIETTGCLICKTDAVIPTELLHWKNAELRFVICQNCGLKYMQQRPTQSWYSTFYKSEFWQESRLKVRKSPPSGEVSCWEEGSDSPGQLEDISLQVNIERQRQRAQRIWRIVRPFVGLRPQSLVLEIGAGWGEFLALLTQQTRCRVMAVEPSELARRQIEKEYGFPLVAHTIEELDEIEELKGKFDLAVLSHVLENTINPIENLRAVRKLLKPTGKIYIDTCNFYYNNAINPYHPYIFSQETINAVLGLAGYEIIGQECEVNPLKKRWITNIEKAKYLATVARPGPVQTLWGQPAFSVLDAQKRGLTLLARARRRQQLWKRMARLFSLKS